MTMQAVTTRGRWPGRLWWGGALLLSLLTAVFSYRYLPAIGPLSPAILANADLTVICERPKIGPHADAMRANLAADLGVSVAQLSVKATTTEQLGFTGRGEGIAAQAVVLLARA